MKRPIVYFITQNKRKFLFEICSYYLNIDKALLPVYKVDPLIRPKCGGMMKVIACLTDSAVDDRVIQHLELTILVERIPSLYIAEQKVLIAAAADRKYFS